MDKEVEAATSVDVLIERLTTHPDEFFNKKAVATYDGDRIFAGTKWRRIVVTLMVDQKPGEANLWMNLFTGPEKDRFRTAMYAALRSELDAQIMMALMQGTAMPRTEEEEKAWFQAQMNQAQMAMQQYRNQYQNQICSKQAAMGNQPLTTSVIGGPPPSRTIRSSFQQYLTDWLGDPKP